MTKDDVAKELITYHFHVEPELMAVYRFKSNDEEASDEPIKLLEVNDATIPSGSIDPFIFASTKDVPYKTVIAEVTTSEFEMLRGDKSCWPEGWDLDRADRFSREEVA
jgi:hypothetical protein